MEEQVKLNQEVDVGTYGIQVTHATQIRLDNYANILTAVQEKWDDSGSSLGAGEVKLTITIKCESKYIFVIK